MTLNALIFDVDGTLADTEELHRQAFNAAFADAGLRWDWGRARYRELLRVTGGKERIAHHIDSLGLGDNDRRAALARVPALHAAKTRHYAALVESGALRLRPGVARLLREAREAGLRLAIASTTSPSNVEALLVSTLGPEGPGLFDVIACGDLVRRKKPAPDVFELALRTLGLEPEEAVAFEDSANGLRAARAAGLWTVVTPTLWTVDEELGEASLLLPHLGDPEQPLSGEPGGRLPDAPWLTLQGLEQLRRPLSTCAVQQLYRVA
ncbi:HAD family hydrolase [Azohydromonas caseinilytica]|uniref:HAD family hydrolase n=1 Tax=Azohydromonas caseinilytica TaxID=2728836 RepID=A0A848F8B7_9BURK|nr:HAD family hydrolase [Azohydromonas caseinilytica]NML15804.1 HAD family hydrolase [Azohydromonas caseinilytica]